MQQKFPLFQTAVDLAHSFWKQLIQPGDIAIDATAGNGYDSLFLTTLPLSELHVFDVQKEAIEATKKRLEGATLSLHFHHLSHEFLDTSHQKESIALIV